jgi:hypothetical protein
MLWVYDLPNSLFAIFVISSFTVFALVGQRWTKRWVRRIFGNSGDYNDLVNTTIATVGVFFGITLGLISVGAWQNYLDINNNVGREVTAINVVYRSVSLYPEPSSGLLKSSIEDYVQYIIQEEWPQQRKGKIPRGGTKKVTAVQKLLYAYEPNTESLKAVHEATISAFNQMIQERRSRLQSVTTGLPETLWLVVILGSIINIIIPWFLVYDRQIVEDLMIVMMAATIGLLVFLMAAMDHPFLGEFSVSPENFQILYDRMKNS